MPAGPSRFVWAVCLVITAALALMMTGIIVEESKLEIEALCLPEAVAAREDPRGYDLVVNVMRDGTIRVRGETCTVEGLDRLLARARVRRAAAVGRDPLVKIRCDADAPYSHVLAVIEGCQQAGIYEVSFGVAQKHILYEGEEEG